MRFHLPDLYIVMSDCDYDQYCDNDYFWKQRYWKFHIVKNNTEILLLNRRNLGLILEDQVVAGFFFLKIFRKKGIYFFNNFFQQIDHYFLIISGS